MENHLEYWAEGVRAYFDCLRPQVGSQSREKLEKYDPGLFKLVDEVYKRSKFRYVRYDRRNPSPVVLSPFERPFPVPAMTPQRKDVKPFEYVDVGKKIPNYKRQ